MHTLDHARNQGREEEYMMMMRQQQMGASQARPMEYPGWEYTPPEAYALPQTSVVPQELVAPQPDVIGSLPPEIPPIIQPGQDMYANMTEEQLMASLLQPESFQPNTQGVDQIALADALRGMTQDDLAFA
tara:strand:- start:283 stop:672 length:390 start_codon:yes stop_codon:yes gene_type:complete